MRIELPLVFLEKINYKGVDYMAKGQIKQKQATINQSTFENLCAIQCTKEEISSVLDISEDTLERWCKETYNKNFAKKYQKFRKIKREIKK